MSDFDTTIDADLDEVSHIDVWCECGLVLSAKKDGCMASKTT